ncbi:MAG TPA: VOC family protein [Actinomycetota bacterium]|nr:VOC family protein [Actinomycetota bacterium]
MPTEPPIRIQCVVIDCADPHGLARFWAAALGWRVTFSSDAECALEPPEGSPETDVSPDLLFVKVPDEKVVKNRLHLDLRPADQQVTVDRLIALGATHAEIGQTGEEPWVVLADPEGNEFCVLAPRPPDG